jgi:hypothetical protein
VLAAAGLAAVIALAGVLIFNRGQDDRPIREAPRPPLAAEPEVATRGSPPTPTPTPTHITARPKTVQDVIAETGEIPPGTRAEDLPIWARPPRVTAQPFPEGARINPPLPPVKIPAEMLVPLPPADAVGATVP